MSAGELMEAAELLELSDRVRPVTLASDRALPVPGTLEGVLPGGGLRRGSIVAVDGPGTTSVLVELLAAATGAGTWAALVDDPTVSVPALAEAGVALDRMVLVHGGQVARSRRATVIGELLEGMGLVTVGPGFCPARSELRRLAARAREQGSVLVLADAESERAALRLRARGAHRRWEHGRLAGCDLVVEVVSRGRASRHRLRVA